MAKTMDMRIQLRIDLWEISSPQDRFFSHIKGPNSEIMWASEGLRSPASCRKSVLKLIGMISIPEDVRRDCEEVGIMPYKGIIVRDMLPGKKLDERY